MPGKKLKCFGVVLVMLRLLLAWILVALLFALPSYLFIRFDYLTVGVIFGVVAVAFTISVTIACFEEMSYRNSMIAHLILMAGFGVLSYLMVKHGYPIVGGALGIFGLLTTSGFIQIGLEYLACRNLMCPYCHYKPIWHDVIWRHRKYYSLQPFPPDGAIASGDYMACVLDCPKCNKSLYFLHGKLVAEGRILDYEAMAKTERRKGG